MYYFLKNLEIDKNYDKYRILAYQKLLIDFFIFLNKREPTIDLITEFSNNIKNKNRILKYYEFNKISFNNKFHGKKYVSKQIRDFMSKLKNSESTKKNILTTILIYDNLATQSEKDIYYNNIKNKTTKEGLLLYKIYLNKRRYK